MLKVYGGLAKQRRTAMGPCYKVCYQSNGLGKLQVCTVTFEVY